MLIIYHEDGRRLCKDGYWRDFANFGDYPDCVKVYRNKPRARRRALDRKARLADIPDGFSVDACGRVYNETREVSIEPFWVDLTIPPHNPVTVQPLLFSRFSRSR